MKYYCFEFLLATVLLINLILPINNTTAQPVKRVNQTPEEQFRFAEGLLKRKFYEMATEEYRNFLARNREHKLAPQAMFRLIECLRGQGKNIEVLSVINQFQARWPKHELAAKLYLWKGELLFREKKYPQAQVCFKKLLLNADSIVQEGSLYFLAQCQIKQDKIEQALKNYAKLAEKKFDGKHLYRPYALYALAASAQYKGEYKKAAKMYKRMIDDKFAPEKLKDESLYRLGENYCVQNKIQDALKCYEDLIINYPKSLFVREARKRRIWAYYTLKGDANYLKAIELSRDWLERYKKVFDYEMIFVYGASLTGAKMYNEAVKQFTLLTNDKRVPESYQRQARYEQLFCWVQSGKYQEVIKNAKLFIISYPKAPELADVHYFTGKALMKLKMLADAEKELFAAVDKYFGNWSFFMVAHLDLAECLIAQKKYADVAKVYRSMSRNKLAEDPAFALLKAGEYENLAKNKKAAIMDYEMVIKLFPKEEEKVRSAMLALGELYAETGKFDKAIILVQKMLKNSDDKAKNRLNFFLGFLYYQQKNYPLAEKILKKVIAKVKTGKVVNDARYYLAGTLLELKRRKEALDIFAELLFLPKDQRPQFSAKMLLRLEKFYFAMNRLKVSEQICRWLINWEEQEVVFQGSLRLGQNMIVSNKLPEVEKFLEKMLKKIEKSGKDIKREEIYSLLGEVYVLNNKNYKAIMMLEDCLKRPDLAQEYLVRAWWGLATVYKRQKKYKLANRYATDAFIRCNDPIYTPKVMMLSLEICVETKKYVEALTVWKELTTRFPAFANQYKNRKIIVELEKKTKK